jgi:hypothetical protein
MRTQRLARCRGLRGRHGVGSSDGPLADQRSVIFAEMELEWQDDGEPILLQVSIMYKVPAVLLALLLSLYPYARRAQTTNGSITGRVTDPAKATIAEAKVAGVNLGMNFRYESTTNTAGEYTLANLPPGTYRSKWKNLDSRNLSARTLRDGILSDTDTRITASALLQCYITQ